jgi:hypothetical protein
MRLVYSVTILMRLVSCCSNNAYVVSNVTMTVVRHCWELAGGSGGKHRDPRQKKIDAQILTRMIPNTSTKVNNLLW